MSEQRLTCVGGPLDGRTLRLVSRKDTLDRVSWYLQDGYGEGRFDYTIRRFYGEKFSVCYCAPRDVSAEDCLVHLLRALRENHETVKAVELA